LGRIAIVTTSPGTSHDGAVQEIADRLRGNGYDVACLDLLDCGWAAGCGVSTGKRGETPAASTARAS
jgi:alpha-beta hydrolase superfamily lysophospholipase